MAESAKRKEYLFKYLKFRPPWPVQCGANFTGPNSTIPAYRQAGAFETANFFMDPTGCQITPFEQLD
jgi:hypothetical protein